MDYRNIRRQIEEEAGRRMSERKLLAVVACALLDIGETLTRIDRRLERMEAALGRVEPERGPRRGGDCE